MPPAKAAPTALRACAVLLARNRPPSGAVPKPRTETASPVRPSGRRAGTALSGADMPVDGSIFLLPQGRTRPGGRDVASRYAPPLAVPSVCRARARPIGCYVKFWLMLARAL